MLKYLLRYFGCDRRFATPGVATVPRSDPKFARCDPWRFHYAYIEATGFSPWLFTNPKSDLQQMHEHAIVHDIVNAAEKQGKVTAISVEVGSLAPIASKDLLLGLRLEKPGWKISVKEVPAKVACGNCGFEGNPVVTERAHDFVLFECKKCGKTPNVLSGKEIMLKKVEVE